MNGDQSFEDPPASEGRGGDTNDMYEDAAEQYVEPDPSQAGEAAAVSETPDALAGVSSQLLDVKRAIEDQLRQGLTQAAGPQSIDSFSGAGNIQGVAIGLGGDLTAGAQATPGEPVITVYVAEPSSADQVRSVIVDSMGVSAAASADVNFETETVGVIDAQPHRFRIRPAP